MQQIIMIGENKKDTIDKIKEALTGKIKNTVIVEVPPYEENILEYVKRNEPAVVIMEVSAAGLNGIETARRIREFNVQVQIILISKLESPALLKEAVRLKVSGYLSQDCEEAGIQKAVEEALSYFRWINAEREGLKWQERVLKEAMKYAEYSFIYTALFSTSFDKEYKRYKRILNLEDYGYIFNLEIEYTEGERPEEESVYYYLKNTVSSYRSCVVGPRIGERIIIFLNFNVKEEKHNTIDDIKTAENIIVKMKEKFGFQMRIGLGGVKPLADIHLSYEEAIRCLGYGSEKSVVEVKDIEKRDIPREAYVKQEEQFLRNVRLGNKSAMDSFAALLKAIRPLPLERRRSKILGLLILADYEARSDSGSDLEYFSVDRINREAGKLDSSELEQWAYNRAEYILNSARSNRLFRKSEAVKNAVRYMEENYMEDVKLEEISRYVGVSPQHLSKIFKEETGMNYIDWLTRLRIESAKKMLVEEKHTIKEVCYRVGYNDPNYFSRIFKKMEGVSPKKYIDGILPNNNN